MPTSIHHISKEKISQLQKIFSRSVGYQISIEDELAYYKAENTANWFVAEDDLKRNIGFIRSFKQDETWSLAEFYLEPSIKNRKTIALQLLANFKTHTQLPPGHRIRFDILESDIDLNLALEEVNLSQKKQVFYHFTMPLVGNFSPQDRDEIFMDPIHVKEIAEVMSHLHPVTSLEVTNWQEKDSLRWIAEEGRICSVLQMSNRESESEILRIATHATYTRKGYARRLLKEVCQELIAKGQRKVFLKVECTRLSAIAFYKNFGFHRNS